MERTPHTKRTGISTIRAAPAHGQLNHNFTQQMLLHWCRRINRAYSWKMCVKKNKNESSVIFCEKGVWCPITDTPPTHACTPHAHMDIGTHRWYVDMHCVLRSNLERIINVHTTQHSRFYTTEAEYVPQTLLSLNAKRSVRIKRIPSNQKN